MSAMSGQKSGVLLRRLAWAGVAAHAVGLGLAALGMRPGTPPFSVEERAAYVAAAPAGWTIGWATWMICALLLVAYAVALADALGGPLARFAATVAAAGMAVDLLCDALQISLLPRLASPENPIGPLFGSWERALALGGQVVANGLYTVAVAGFGVALRGRPRMSLAGAACALTVAGGALMVGACFASWSPGLPLGTAVAIGGYCAWTLLVARALDGEAA
jgi:hypothetical protein